MHASVWISLVFATACAPPPPPPGPPSIELVEPAPGMIFHGAVKISARVTAPAGFSLAHVRWFANGEVKWPVCSFVEPPFECVWNTSQGRFAVPDGQYELRAELEDQLLQRAYSVSVPLTVEDRAPTVAFSSPLPGATLTGLATIAVTPLDDGQLSTVEVHSGATSLRVFSVAPFEFQWNSQTVPNGAHTLTVTATDVKAQTATSTVTFEVSNP